MPGRSGLAVCEHIKSTAHLAHIPVILLVGVFEPFDKGEAGRVRYDGVLTKPFETKQLLQMVWDQLVLSAPKDADDVIPIPENPPMPIEPVTIPIASERNPGEDSGATIMEAPPEASAPIALPALDVTSETVVLAPLNLPGPELSQVAPMEWITYDPDAKSVDENCILELDEPEIGLSSVQMQHPAPAKVVLPGEQPPQPNADSTGIVSLSEPMIDDIVRRVIQKLSDQVVRDVAWEVVPEMAESAIREELRKHPRV